MQGRLAVAGGGSAAASDPKGSSVVGVLADPETAPVDVATQLAADLPDVLRTTVDDGRTWSAEVVEERLLALYLRRPPTIADHAASAWLATSGATVAGRLAPASRARTPCARTPTATANASVVDNGRVSDGPLRPTQTPRADRRCRRRDRRRAAGRGDRGRRRVDGRAGRDAGRPHHQRSVTGRCDGCSPEPASRAGGCRHQRRVW